MGSDFVGVVGLVPDTDRSLPLQLRSTRQFVYMHLTAVDSWPRNRRLLGEGARRSPKSLRVGDFSGSIPSEQHKLTQNSKFRRREKEQYSTS